MAASTAASELPFADLVTALAAQHEALVSQHTNLQAEYASLQRECQQLSDAHDIHLVGPENVEDIHMCLAGVDTAAAMAEAPAERRACPYQRARGDEGPDPDAGFGSSSEDEPRRPSAVAVLPAWTDIGSAAASASVRRRSTLSGAQISEFLSQSASFHNDGSGGKRNKWFMLHPSSTKRILWDCLAIAVLGYDVMMTPMMAFEMSASLFTEVMDFTTTTFWTLDIGLSFITGYWKIYAAEMRPCHVACHYVQRSFIPDLLIGTFDWVMYGLKTNMSHTSDVMRLTKIMRTVRIIRVLRLVRLVRLPNLLNTVLKSLQSEVARSIAGIVRNLILIIVVNHFVACIWYTMRLVGSPSWADVLEEESRSIPYRYWTAMHWSITQFTPASMEVQPRNAAERCFAICVVFFGLVMFSSFISSITTTMATIRMSMQLEQTTKAKVMRYMTERRVSIHLGGKIAAFLESYKFTARPVHRKDIAIFSVLPMSLQLKLDWEVNQPVLARHSLLNILSQFDEVSMLELCSSAEELSLGMREELFHPGKVATVIYFTVSGCLRCFHGFAEFHARELRCENHLWLCEPALWLEWRNRGHAIAVTACSFVILGSTAVQNVVCQRPRLRMACQIYAGLVKDDISARIGKIRETEPAECGMFGDFEADLDSCLEKAQVAFEKAEELNGTFKVAHSSSLKLARSGGHLGSEL